MDADETITAMAMMPGAVDLRVQEAAEDLSPIDRIALRSNLKAEKQAGFGEPDKLIVIAIYARYSTGRQKQKSIERQVAIVAAYMRSLGYAIYVLYADPARSARSTHRERLQALLADCRAGKIKIIMVEDFDRWSRETYDAVLLCEELSKLGVEFHSAGDRKALSKKETIEAALKAEADRERRNAIMSMGRLQHAADGGAHSGTFFGYRYGEDPGYLVPYPAEAEVITEVFTMAAAGVSYRTIGKTMRARGALGPTKNCKWTKATVANILGQLAYTGRWYYPFTRSIYNREKNTVTKVLRHPNEMSKRHFERMRIVSDELFFTVNGRRRPRGSPRHEYPHFLEGKVVCDCAVDGQLFIMNRQMTCNYHCEGATCPGRSHSVMLAPIEKAVLETVSAKIRSVVREDDFASAVDRSLRKAAARRRTARAAIEREIADARAEQRRLLDDHVQQDYDEDIIADKRQDLRKARADAQARLEALPELPEFLDAAERVRALSDTLDEISARVPFRARTNGEAQVSLALARLVRRVTVMRDGLPTGFMRLRIQFDFLHFLHEGDHPGAAGPAGPAEDVVEVDVEQFMGRHARLSAEIAELRATGAYKIDDGHWDLVANLLPDVTSRRVDSRHLSTRDVVDALMLCLRTGLFVTSTAYGDTVSMRRAVIRFVYAAGDQILIDALRAADPSYVAGLDLRPVEAARTRWRVGDDDWRKRRGSAARLHALDGRTALDDEQWSASEPLLHPCVELSYKGTPGLPGRLLLEALILALRTGLSWRRLPARFGEGAVVHNSIRRLVSSGSWDRLLELWSDRFPELADGLDTGRLAGLLRGSAQWRGPSPKRSIYGRSGGLAPARPQLRARPVRRRRRMAE